MSEGQVTGSPAPTSSPSTLTERSQEILKPADRRPRARGWIHFYSSIVSGLAGIPLTVVCWMRLGLGVGVSCLVYVTSILLMFMISSIYHIHEWGVGGRGRRWMKRADHSAIFIFIGGTYTPFCILALDLPIRIWVLLTVWIGAGLGVIMTLLWPTSPKWIQIPLYILLGWEAVLVSPKLVQVPAALVLLVTGGLLYTIGAIMYGIKHPNPAPKIFGYHECFHAAVSAAALCHYCALWVLAFAKQP